MKIQMLILIIMTSTAFYSCKKNSTDSTSSTDIQETAQQVGDVMASVDESGGSSGSIAYLDNSVRQTFARNAPSDFDEEMLAQIFLPKAEAASCSASGTFGSCASGVITRTFGGCTVGSAVFSGDVTLTWSGATASSCTLAASGSSIVRVPNFTVTGRRGAVLSVAKTGSVGQTVTWVSGTGASKTFSFDNDGINRKFTSGSTTLFDITTTVTSNISVTGISRSNRVMNGGNLRVVDNLNSVTCNFAPTSVTWTSSCNCATSGSWAGSCSNGNSVNLTITGCGTATYTQGDEEESVTFDRCGT